MAILSGQRCQTIHALSQREMQVSDSKAVFSVNECLKITKLRKYLSYNFYPSTNIVISMWLGIFLNT